MISLRLLNRQVQMRKRTPDASRQGPTSNVWNAPNRIPLYVPQSGTQKNGTVDGLPPRSPRAKPPFRATDLRTRAGCARSHNLR